MTQPFARSRAARPTLSLAEVRRNAVAGLVVGIIALPLSIALAVAVGAPPIAGLYTAIFAGAVASVFGGSEFNITGPTAALVPILSTAVLKYGLSALPTVAVMAGVLLVLMGLLRLGGLIRYMPRLVIVGFTAGIALSIAFGQLNNLLAVTGTNPALEHFHEKTIDTLTHLNTVEPTTPLIGLLSLGILVAWPRVPVVGRVPAPLAAVVLVTALVWRFEIDTPTLASRYGELPRGLPAPKFDVFDFGIAFDLLPVAVSVAILGAVESLLSAVVADGMSGGIRQHNPNRELVGQGLANIVSPVMGGLPATAAIARTGAGIRSGATSRLTGVFHALTVLAATLALGGLAGHIPLTTLAAILLVVAWNIADVPEVVRLLRTAPREDLLVLVSTALITLFFDLSYAVGFGVLVSAILLIRRMIQAPAAEVLHPHDFERRHAEAENLVELAQRRPDVALVSARGLLSFHSAAALEQQLSAIKRPVVLVMDDVHHIDTSGLMALETVVEQRERTGEPFLLAAIHPDVLPVLERFGLLERLGPGRVFQHTHCAVAAIEGPRNGGPAGKPGLVA